MAEPSHEQPGEPFVLPRPVRRCGNTVVLIDYDELDSGAVFEICMQERQCYAVCRFCRARLIGDDLKYHVYCTQCRLMGYDKLVDD
jgi:hypothetical protein